MNNPWVVVTDKYSKDHYFNSNKIRKFVYDYKEQILYVHYEDKTDEPLKDVSPEEARKALQNITAPSFKKPYQPNISYKKPPFQSREYTPNTLRMNGNK